MSKSDVVSKCKAKYLKVAYARLHPIFSRQNRTILLCRDSTQRTRERESRKIVIVCRSACAARKMIREWLAILYDCRKSLGFPRIRSRLSEISKNNVWRPTIDLSLYYRVVVVVVSSDEMFTICVLIRIAEHTCTWQHTFDANNPAFYNSAKWLINKFHSNASPTDDTLYSCINPLHILTVEQWEGKENI